MDHVADLAEEVAHNSQRCGQMQKDIIGKRGLSDPQELWSQHQMSGTRNREELRSALDDTQDYGLQNTQVTRPPDCLSELPAISSQRQTVTRTNSCLLYTSDAADE